MQTKIYLIIGLLLGLVIGWGLSYLGLPMVEVEDSFWVGVLFGCAGLFTFLLVLYRFVLGNRLYRLMQPTTEQGKGYFLRIRRAGFVLSAVLVLLGIVFANEWSSKNADNSVAVRAKDIYEETKMYQMHQNNQLSMLHFWMLELSREMAHSDSLSVATTQQIVAWTHAIKPYDKSLMDPSLKISPERGLLLQELVKLDLDSVSMASILTRATFAYADLRSCSFKGIGLKGIDLYGAQLEAAVFEEVDLSKATLNKADLRYATFLKVRLDRANLNGIQAEGIQFDQTEAHAVQLEWADMPTATFRASIFREGSFKGVNLYKSSLQNTQLLGINFKKSRLEDALLNKMQLDSLIVSQNWVDMWQGWAIVSDVNLLDQMTISVDSSNNSYRWIQLVN
jgi:uncharacterized protein YjbI with pentapeptide repeats